MYTTHSKQQPWSVTWCTEWQVNHVYCHSFVIGGDGNVYECRGWNKKVQKMTSWHCDISNNLVIGFLGGCIIGTVALYDCCYLRCVVTNDKRVVNHLIIGDITKFFSPFIVCLYLCDFYYSIYIFKTAWPNLNKLYLHILLGRILFLPFSVIFQFKNCAYCIFVTVNI